MDMSEFDSPEAAEDAEKIAEAITKFVNRHNAKDHLALGGLLCVDHRTLVQAKWSIFLGYLKKLKENKDIGQYDGRNEAACNFAEEILTKTEAGKYDRLPFI